MPCLWRLFRWGHSRLTHRRQRESRHTLARKRRPSGADHEEQPPELIGLDCGPIVEVPRSFLSTLKAELFSLAQARLETALLAGRPHRGMECRQRLWMSIAGSSSGDV